MEKIQTSTLVHDNADIHPDAMIGDGGHIYPWVYIEADVIIGDRCNIKPFCYIPNGTKIGNDVFIGMGTQVCNDKHPHANNNEFKQEGVTIEDSASIGANVTILPGVTIGRTSLIGAGSVVTRDVHPFAIVAGNPAKEIKR